VGDWAERLAAVGSSYFGELLRHDTDGPFWWATDVRRRVASIEVPMLHVGSWYDAFQYDTLRLFNDLRTAGATEAVRRGQRLVVGPWGHLQPYTTPNTGGAGDIDFGADAAIELFDEQLRWFDHHLKGIDTGILDEPPVRLFVMGVNRWRDEDEWPLRRAVARELYLHGAGDARSSRGDGTTSFGVPGDEPHDTFIYDPHDPVPTCGGPIPGPGLGVKDQRGVEQRADVLVYSSAPLDEPLEITGHVRAVLHASSSARDTDFTVKLVDVWPDGFAQNLVEGIVRARYRDSLSEPTEIEPDRVYRYEIDLGATSHVVLSGHALRVDVSSSNFPRHDRNPNTGRSPLVETDLRTATQRVFHDSRYPSHLVLPVVPR
jgi:putative CocE/NonD family hydrolase